MRILGTLANLSDENGTDPISGEALSKDDLIEVKASEYNIIDMCDAFTNNPEPSTLPPRAANQTSIPALLSALQSEYDSIMLESLEIKKAFQSARAELANALYREDAATRVIARLMQERDEARQALSSIQTSIGIAPGAQAAEDVEMESEPQSVLPKDVEEKIMATNQAYVTLGQRVLTPDCHLSGKSGNLLLATLQRSRCNRMRTSRMSHQCTAPSPQASPHWISHRTARLLLLVAWTSRSRSSISKARRCLAH